MSAPATAPQTLRVCFSITALTSMPRTMRARRHLRSRSNTNSQRWPNYCVSVAPCNDVPNVAQKLKTEIQKAPGTFKRFDHGFQKKPFRWMNSVSRRIYTCRPVAVYAREFCPRNCRQIGEYNYETVARHCPSFPVYAKCLWPKSRYPCCWFTRP